MFWKNRKAAVAREVAVPQAPLTIPMDLMDAAFDRTAGRWCSVCSVHGSHHSDKHDDFARHALDLENRRVSN